MVSPRYPFRHVDAVEKPFPSQLVTCQYCEKLPQMNSTSPRLAGRRSFRFVGVAAFSTFYVIVVWMLNMRWRFAGMAESDALKTIS